MKNLDNKKIIEMAKKLKEEILRNEEKLRMMIYYNEINGDSDEN